MAHGGVRWRTALFGGSIAVMEHLPDHIQAALAEDLTIDITTTGRSSGEPRRIEIWFMNVDGTVYITGTPGPRDWYANLIAHPQFTFHLKGSAIADLAANAAPVSDHDERRRLFEAATSEWYVQRVPIHEMTAAAPVVRVSFD